MMRPGPPSGAGGAAGAAGAQCDAMLLGRELVEGAVHASSLACLVRGLAGTKARPNRQGRRYLLRCSDVGVELVARRPALRPLGTGLAIRGDDEGFESDEDRRSTRSDDSTSVSSSCCLVDDHVFKAGQGVAAPTPSSTSSDSANSSGGSDTDEVDAKAPHDAVSVDTASSAAAAAAFRENFSFQDVAFCHVDAAFPRVVVLVVRRGAAPRRLRATVGPSGPSGLEALVLECRGEEGVRALCSAYQELSRRARMDGAFRAPHRRKDEAPKDAATATTVVSGSGAVLPKFIFSKVDEAATATAGEASRFNLVQRTDGDGVTHIEVSRGTGASLVSVDDATAGGAASADAADDDHLCGPSSIISISTPDAGNILSTADRNRISKEIEGVIRADVENNATLRRDAGHRDAGHRQRQHPDEPKLWTTALTADDDAATAGLGLGLSGPSSLPPPQRPERKRFVRKNKAPAPPAPAAPQADASAMTLKKEVVVLNNTLNRVGRPLSGGAVALGGAEQRVVRGQFIRVSVDQQAKQQAKQQAWPAHPHVSHFPAGWTGPPPARSAGPAPQHAPHHPWGVYPDVDHRRYQRRSRSSDSGRGQQPAAQSRPRSPPAPRRPMAYRYIDAHTPAPAPPRQHLAAPGATTNSLSNRFFGLSQKLREIGGSVVGGVGGYPGSGRRNSWGDSPTRFYTSLEPPKPAPSNNLKSVIKKNHAAGPGGAAGTEPKKVTFSAYATVQVVD